MMFKNVSNGDIVLVKLKNGLDLIGKISETKDDPGYYFEFALTDPFIVIYRTTTTGSMVPLIGLQRYMILSADNVFTFMCDSILNNDMITPRKALIEYYNLANELYHKNVVDMIDTTIAEALAARHQDEETQYKNILDRVEKSDDGLLN